MSPFLDGMNKRVMLGEIASFNSILSERSHGPARLSRAEDLEEAPSQPPERLLIFDSLDDLRHHSDHTCHSCPILMNCPPECSG